MVVLPATFVGSPRDMNQLYQDSMALVKKFGKPNLFITMTCNPNWPEILHELRAGEEASSRPDLTSLCQAPEHWPHQILKGGRRLLCANLVDPAPASAARGGGPAAGGATGVSGGHKPPPVVRGGGAAPAATLGLSAEHDPRRATRDRSRAAAAPGLLAGHGPRCAVRGRNRAVAAAPGLSAGHRPQRAAHGRSRAVVVAPDLSAGHGPRRAARGYSPTTATELGRSWVFGFNFQLVIQNTLVSITTSLGHTLWCNLVHIVKIFVSYEMEFSKLIN